jgi:uracil-DNA glycosylase family 4
MKKILLIGEAWGAQEEMESRQYGYPRPFVGPAGHELDSILKQLGRKREDFYILNIFNEKPPGNDFGTYYEDSTHNKPTQKLKDAWERLNNEIESLNPNVIITLGREPLRALCGMDYYALSNWRGSILSSVRGRKVIPTYHPSLLVRGGRISRTKKAGDSADEGGVPVRPVMIMDFKKAFKQSASPEIRYKKRDRIIPQYLEWVVDWLRSSYGPLAVDIETEQDTISCVGFANSPTSSVCIPFVSGPGKRYWTQGDEEVIIAEIKEVLENPEIEIIGQNFSYDMTWFKELWGIEVANYKFDTLVAQSVVFPDFPQGLDFINSMFTDIPYYKDDGKNHKLCKDYPKLWQYNCNDVLATFEGAEKLKQELDFYDLHEVFEYEMRMTRAMFKIARRGILIDKEKKREYLIEANRQLKRWDEKITEIVGHDLNLRSPKQIKEYLFGDLKMKPIIDKGKVTTNENALKKLQVKYPKNEFIQILMKYRKLAKLRDTYLKGVKLDPDDRVRCSYGWTANGRLSSYESPFNTGLNLQNIPREELEF